MGHGYCRGHQVKPPRSARQEVPVEAVWKTFVIGLPRVNARGRRPPAGPIGIKQLRPAGGVCGQTGHGEGFCGRPDLGVAGTNVWALVWCALWRLAGERWKPPYHVHHERMGHGVVIMDLHRNGPGSASNSYASLAELTQTGRAGSVS